MLNKNALHLVSEQDAHTPHPELLTPNSNYITMDLNYKVIHSSRRKTLTITVERDRSIVVKAPTGTSPDKISKSPHVCH